MQGVRWTAPTATYLICTNPRSGSWLLSEGLASTSVAGKPREWFNTLEEQNHRASWRMKNTSDLSYEAYLALARKLSTSSNGISGIKLHYCEFAELPRRMESVPTFQGLTSAEIMTQLFPRAKYIWLTRRDKTRQAISYLIAAQTDEWWSIDGATPEKREGALDSPAFDPHAIARQERALVENDAKWQEFFDENGIDPLMVAYEDMVTDYDGTIFKVLNWLGVSDAASVRIPPPRLKPQSNGLNEDWLTRYEAIKAGGDLRQGPSSTDEPNGLLRRPETVHAAWKQWVAHQKLFRANDDAIVEVLTNNGYSRATALAEMKKAAADPYLLGAVRAHQRLKKGAILLNILGQLARLNSNANVIDRRRNLLRNQFRDQYYAANRPVIIEGLMSHWKAMTKWTPDYLKDVVGDRIVEVMTSRDADPQYEINGSKHRTDLSFAAYVDMVYSGKITNDYYMVANNAFLQRPEAKPLLEDFTAFPEYLNPVPSGNQCFLWFGPAGTVTPLHHDTSNILIAQVAGRKRYRMIPTSQWQYVYNSSGVFSDVDCENPDFHRHPNFRNATVIDVVLEAGEVLFVPVGWWHHVRALDVSLTVSFTSFLFPNHFVLE